MYQTLDSVQSKKITASPNKILDNLKKFLTPHPSETYTIAFWKRDGTGGHAVTPYAVDYKGDGKYEVMIYDNNWPGQTRAIAFDTKADTWSYDAATNPSDPTELYEGDADTQTMSLFPTSPGRSTQPCPFCGTVPSSGSTSTAGTTEATRTALIYLIGGATNHSHVLITDHAGHRLGYVNGKLVNEIPGAHYVLLTADQVWQNKLEPLLFVPANVAYTITLDGTPLTSPDTESIGIIGPSWHVAVNDIVMHPGDKDTLTADPNATKLTYSTTRAQSPTIQAAVSEARAHYAFVIAGVSNQPGSTINLSVPHRRWQSDHQQRRLGRGVERKPCDDPLHRAGGAEFQPPCHPPDRRGHRRASVRQLDQPRPGHPVGHHPQRTADDRNAHERVSKLESYLLGSYRIATAPEPNSSWLTSFKSTCFDSPANNVGPWPASLGCTTNSYSSINPSSVNASGSFTPPTSSPLPDSRLSC